MLSGISIIHNPDVFLLPIHPLLHPSQATASLLNSPHCIQLPIFCSTTCTLQFFNSQLFTSMSPVLSCPYFHSISCTQLPSYAVSLYPRLFLHSQLGQSLSVSVELALTLLAPIFVAFHHRSLQTDAPQDRYRKLGSNILYVVNKQIWIAMFI